MSSTIINIDQAKDFLPPSNSLFVDCRASPPGDDTAYQAFLSSHITGAVHAHLENDLSGKIIIGKTSRHPLPSVNQFEATIQKWGITPSTQVIAYDDKGGAYAARLWWMLRWVGHQNVAVLDGGWQAWQNANLPTASGEAFRQASDYQINKTGRKNLDRGTVNQIRTDNNFALIDSRAHIRYIGQKEPLDPIAGHIPGAINLPFTDNLNEDKTFKSKKELADRFVNINHIPSEKVVFYCGSGVTACHNILAYEYANQGEASLYPGSWSEWITQPNPPLATE